MVYNCPSFSRFLHSMITGGDKTFLIAMAIYDIKTYFLLHIFWSICL